MKFTKEAQDYFDRHPSSNECHITSDGRVWHNKGGAQGFAGTLDDQTIESYDRKVFTDKKYEEIAERIAKENKEFLDEKTKLLQETDIETAEYAVLKDFAKVFKIKTDDQKAETLKVAITNFKNQLQKPTE